MKVHIDSSDMKKEGMEIIRESEEAKKEMEEVIIRASMEAQAEVRESSPVFMGVLSNSIHLDVPIIQNTPEGIRVEGSIFTNEPHGAVQEDGRAPNSTFPPIEAIRRWVRLKVRRSQFQLQQRKGESKLAAYKRTAFLVARKIAQEGTKAHHMFEWVQEKYQTVLTRRVERFAQTWIAKLER